MEKIKEIKMKDKKLQEFVDKQKQALQKLFGTENVKLVEWRFAFLVDDEILEDLAFRAEGFNRDDFEHD